VTVRADRACDRSSVPADRKSHPKTESSAPFSDDEPRVLATRCRRAQTDRGCDEDLQQRAGSHRAATAPMTSRSCVLGFRVSFLSCRVLSRSFTGSSCTFWRSAPPEIGIGVGAAATSAWWIPESLPPAVHGGPQRPRRPGQGTESRAAVRIWAGARAAALRLREFARPRPEPWGVG
jgi:hypothetical protein